MKTSFDLKVKISGLNKSSRYQHWGKQANLSKKHRTLAAIATSNQIVARNIKGSLKYVVTFTRFGKRKLDDDNLIGGLKHIRDGVSDALGVNDGSDRITFHYKQEIHSENKLTIMIEEF